MQKYLNLFIFSLVVFTTQLTFGMDPETDPLYNYELFKVVQRIRDIVDQTRGEARKLCARIDSGRVAWPKPSPFYYQTESGLILIDDSALGTPWGKIMLTRPDYSGKTKCLFMKELFKNFTTTFYKICGYEKVTWEPCEVSTKFRYCIIQSENDWVKLCSPYTSYGEIFTEEMTEDEINSTMIDQDVVIISNKPVYKTPIYRVHAAKGTKEYILPTPELLNHSNYREYEDVMIAWNTLQERYKAEQELNKASSHWKSTLSQLEQEG